MSGFLKSAALWAILIIIGLMFFQFGNPLQRTTTKTLSYPEFLRNLETGEIKQVTMQAKESSGVESGVTVSGTLSDGTPFKTFTSDPRIHDILRESGIDYDEAPYSTNYFAAVLIQVLPILLILGAIWYFAYRQMQAGGNKALSFGKSRARLHAQGQPSVTFNDVAGVDEAKEELKEIIDFLKDPKKFTKLGGRIPKGVLLVGPPGSGKTLLARAVAGEAKVPFFSISGSDFVEMFVGVGASRVRDLFQQGQKHAPCIIFIDELDAVGRQRGTGLGGGHDEREQTLNQLLVEMDGFDSNEGVILVAATNRPDVLDKALLRPGRFDRHIVVDNPDVIGREGILKVHTKHVPLAEDVDLKVMARATPGFSGADLANMVNEAALLAARKEKETVNMKDLEEAKDKVLMGPERRSIFISEQEKKITAYHEAGHTLLSMLLPNSDPVHKVTIIPRGRALGLTQQLPIEDRHTYSKGYLKNLLTIWMGGRVAEELIFAEITNGAANDLKNATNLARRMISEWGMSARLGPATFGENDEVFLGRDILKERNFSEGIAFEIDEEIRRTLDEAYEQAKTILSHNEKSLKKLAETLMEREVIDGSELDEILKDTLPSPQPCPEPQKQDKVVTG